MSTSGLLSARVAANGIATGAGSIDPGCGAAKRREPLRTVTGTLGLGVDEGLGVPRADQRPPVAAGVDS